jgi:hypothetical protein
VKARLSRGRTALAELLREDGPQQAPEQERQNAR